MCSLTFWPRRDGFRLAMNRDEQRRRIPGRPPECFQVGQRRILHPTEPGGGTWISLNDHGVVFALLNAYSIETQSTPDAGFRSRGAIILALRDAVACDEASARLQALNLRSTRPFRLFGFFDRGRQIQEWTWNAATVSLARHRSVPAAWHSSGYQEPEAQRLRGETVRSRLQDPDAGTLEWLRRLHGSHAPVCGPFSICMHREDAATVSYSEVEVTAAAMTLRHHQGALCGTPAWSVARSLRAAEVSRTQDPCQTGAREWDDTTAPEAVPNRAA